MNGGTAGAVDPMNGNGQPTSQPSGGSAPNAFERLLPTAGGILGGIIGAPANLLDAIGVPGTLGDIAAAGAGGSLGKALENKLTGNNVGSGVLGSGIENAAGQGIGSAVGAGLGAAGGLLGNVAGRASSKLIQGQAVKGALDQATADALGGHGITDLDQASNIANTITGNKGALTNGIGRGMQESDMPADLSGLSDKATQLLSENQMQLSGNSIPDIQNTVQKALISAVNPEDITNIAAKGGQPIRSFAPGALANVLPENALQVGRNFDSLASKAYGAIKGSLSPDPEQVAKAKIFSGLAEHAKNAAFGGDAGLPISDENRAQIISELAPIKDANPTAYNSIVQQVSNAKTLQDLRPIQAPFVNASKAVNATNVAADKGGGSTATSLLKTAAPVVGGATAGPLGAMAGALPMLVGNKAADKVGASTLSKVSNLLTNKTMKGLVKAAAPPTAIAATNLPNYAGATPGGTMAPTAMTNPAGAVPAAGATASPEALQMMLGLIGLQADPYMASTFAPMISGSVKPLQQAQTANSALGGLESQYNAAGGGQGGASGLLSRLAALIPGSAGHQYNQQASQLQQTLQGLGVPGTVTPSIMSGAGTSQASFSTLQSIINALGGQNGASVLSGVPAQ